MTTDNKENVRALLAPLIEEARAKELWLWCFYQDIWMSPSELAAANAAGKFLWDPVNWKLRAPAEHLVYLQQKVEDARENVQRFLKRIGDDA